jgi:hypothetical protein
MVVPLFDMNPNMPLRARAGTLRHTGLPVLLICNGIPMNAENERYRKSSSPDGFVAKQDIPRIERLHFQKL